MSEHTRRLNIVSYIVSSLRIPIIYYVLAVGILAGVYFITKKLPLSLLIAYSFLVLSETVLARNASASVEAHWIPLWFLWVRSPRSWLGGFSQIAANMVMFIPIGFLLTYTLKRCDRAVRISAIFSFCLEMLQLLLHRGIYETDDVIGNSIGAFLGYLLYQGFCWLKVKYATIKDQVKPM